MSDETHPAWKCLKDGAAMQPLGRWGRGGAWRCPMCGAIFLDTEAMRRGRAGSPPWWAPVVTSVLVRPADDGCGPAAAATLAEEHVCLTRIAEPRAWIGADNGTPTRILLRLGHNRRALATVS